VSHFCNLWRPWSENTSQLIPICLTTTSITTEIKSQKFLLGSCTDLHVDSGSNLKCWLRLLLQHKMQTPAGVHSSSVIISWSLHEKFLKVYLPVAPDGVLSYWKKNCLKIPHRKNIPSRWQAVSLTFIATERFFELIKIVKFFSSLAGGSVKSTLKIL